MKNNENHKARFAFFGTEPLAEAVLDELEQAGFRPALIVADRDKIGRNKKVELPVEKKWAEERGISVMQPEKIDADFLAQLKKESWDFFVVASYGKMLPESLLDIPVHGVLNIHPSLLPRLRGPSPIRSTILNDERETGVTIMLMDDKIDHGPIIAQRSMPIADEYWPIRGSELDMALARLGGALLATVLPEWLAGHIEAREQNHDLATYTQLMKKEDGLLDLKANGYSNLLKVRAYEGWPSTYAFFERAGKKIRVQILDAHLDGANLVIDRVKPEGKRAMSYEEFLRSGARPIE